MTTTFVSDAEQASMRTYYEQSMGSSVQLYRAAGAADRYGKIPHSGTPEPVKARIGQINEVVFNAAGVQAVAVTKISVPYGTGVSPNDVIELPNGTKPVILSVDNWPNESWPLAEQIRTGKA